MIVPVERTGYGVLKAGISNVQVSQLKSVAQEVSFKRTSRMSLSSLNDIEKGERFIDALVGSIRQKFESDYLSRVGF